MQFVFVYVNAWKGVVHCRVFLLPHDVAVVTCNRGICNILSSYKPELTVLASIQPQE